MSGFFGKTVLVTGAAKGIGAAIARSFGREGANVVVNYLRDAEGAARVAGDIVAAGGQALTVQGDVSLAADVRRVFAAARVAFGRLHVLVNNAGIYEFEAIGALTEASVRRMLDLNVVGLLLCTQAAVQAFAGQGARSSTSDRPRRRRRCRARSRIPRARARSIW